MSEVREVQLSNGKMVPEPLLQTVALALDDIEQNDPAILAGLIFHANDLNWPLGKEVLKVLVKHSLIVEGEHKVSQVVADIISARYPI